MRVSEYVSHNTVEHIAAKEYDHMALLIRVAATSLTRTPVSDRGFGFKEMLTRHDSYDNNTVQEACHLSIDHGSWVQWLWSRLKDISVHLRK
jgi:hypothetical protein